MIDTCALPATGTPLVLVASVIGLVLIAAGATALYVRRGRNRALGMSAMVGVLLAGALVLSVSGAPTASANEDCVPKPSATTPAPTSTASPSATPSATAPATPTGTATPTATPSPTASPTSTPTPTPTPTVCAAEPIPALEGLTAEFKTAYDYDYDGGEYPPFGPGEIQWNTDESGPSPDLQGWLWLTATGTGAPVTDLQDLGATFDYTAEDTVDFTVYEWTVDGVPVTDPLLPMGPQQYTAPSVAEEITAELAVEGDEGSTLEPLFPSSHGLGVQLFYSGDPDVSVLSPLDAAAQAYAAANGGVVPEYNVFDENNQDESYIPVAIVTTFTFTITVEDSCGEEIVKTFSFAVEHSAAA